MPREEAPTIALPLVANAAVELRRPWKGDGGLVLVDAVYHVPEIHPSNEGPWATEADKVAWTDPMTGYGCIIRRHPAGGHLCGYVSVQPGHPLFGRETGTLRGIMIGVHGGLDYSAACEDWEDEDRSVCHPNGVPPGFQQGIHRNEAANDDAWWFGFSCDKRTDLLPDDARRPREDRTPVMGIDDPTYKTEAFVYGECIRLAAQMKAIERNLDPRSADPGPTIVDQSEAEYRR